MARSAITGAGAFLLLSSAQAGSAPAAPGRRLPAASAGKPPVGAGEVEGGWPGHAYDDPSPRTWEAALLSQPRHGVQRTHARRERSNSIVEALRGGAGGSGGGRGGGRGRGVKLQQRQGRGGGGGSRQVRWEDEEDDGSYDNDESEGYDDSEYDEEYDEEYDLSEEVGPAYRRRATATGGASNARWWGGRKGPAPAKNSKSGFYGGDDDFEGEGSDLYDSEDEGEFSDEIGSGSYDDDEFHNDGHQYDEDDSFGDDLFDYDEDDSGRVYGGSDGRRRPQPSSWKGAWGGGGGGGGRGAGARGKRKEGPASGGRAGSRRGRRGPPPPARMEQLKAKLAGAQVELKAKVSGVTHKGAKVMRELKGSVSSDLEKTLIKATRPDNDPAKRKHVNLLLQAAEHSFPAYMNPRDDSLAYWREGPYWMTLHKLWRRMAEKDYRTATKAVYLLHRLARGTTTESWGYFRSTLQQMRREDDKGTKSRYFSRRVIRNVDQDAACYSEWLDAYADFALLRLQSFAPDLSELAAVDAETPHEEASRSLEKAAKLIEAALACEIGPDLDNDVTCDGLKLVIEDLCELWSLFQQKLEIRLQQRFAGGGFTSAELRRTLSFLEFYLEQLSAAKALVRESYRLLKMYHHAVPKGLGDALATEMLQEQVAWIQEELAEKAKAKAKASLSKSVTGSGGGGGAPPATSPPASAQRKRTAGGAGEGTAKTRKPRAAAVAPVAASATPAAPAQAATAQVAPAAASPKTIASKKTVAEASNSSGGGGSGGGGGGAGSAPAGAAAKRKAVDGGGGKKKSGKKAEGAGAGAAASKTTKKKRSPSSSSKREL